MTRWIVQAAAGAPHFALLRAQGLEVPLSIGRSGIRPEKREGDGATPAGVFPLRRLLYRADRLALPPTALPAFAIGPSDGWCDDPSDSRYNQPVRLPFPASAEALWRSDGLYDLILVMGHNDDPPRKGLGSAVFFHLRRPDNGPTAGCLAASLDHMLALLALAKTDTQIEIQAG